MGDEPKFSKRYGNGSWIIPLVGLGVNGLILLINLVVSSGYVPKSEFNNLRDQFETSKLSQQAEMSQIRENQLRELGKIAEGVASLNEKMRDNARQDEQLKDHEQRIRELSDKIRK